jgi:subtilisin family serine protease
VGWCLDPSTSTDGPAYYTNTGQSVIDVAAPGGNFAGAFEGSPHTDPCTVGFLTRSSYIFDGVFSTIAGGWGWAQGTSMAAPHATGVAALLISANGGDMSPSQVERALKAAAEDLGSPGHDAIYGAGRVTAGY